MHRRIRSEKILCGATRAACRAAENAPGRAPRSRGGGGRGRQGGEETAQQQGREGHRVEEARAVGLGVGGAEVDAGRLPVPQPAEQTALGQTRAVHRFTPIYGALTSDASASSGISPMCYLLEFDGVNILLDCGSSERFDMEALEPLRDIAPRVHLVLLSHARLEHLGALPYAVAKFGLNAPIYCTLPVKRMGEMYFYDALIAREWGPGAEEVRVACDEHEAAAAATAIASRKMGNGEPITATASTVDPSSGSSTSQPFTVDDVDAAFDRFRTLNYRQNLTVNTPGGTIVITPYPAGGGLGRALWGIKKETDLIVYANHFNHRKSSTCSSVRLVIPN